ncbi:MAG TPA: glycosyltransferase family 4 protein [Acetobacteraceae bacterium]|nr:glycosyltransferase family 4 protein [Acetobacteraceae bacterium]
MQIALFVPAPFATVSGGYVYDRRMVAEWRAEGHAVEVIELPGRHPLADGATEAAALTAWAALPDNARPLIDGLALPAFAPMAEALAARGATTLIHHPTALETGLPDAERGMLRTIEHALLPRLHRVVTTSADTAERLARDFGVAAERIAVVVPGTGNAPRSVGSGGTGCAILSIGTLVPRKGHDVLLRAMARLFDLDWHLTIVGGADRDPAHAAHLAALASELGIARQVHFTGELVDAALEAAWQPADLFALATHYEGYGMVVAEALKRGLPVAICGGGAVGSLVPAEAGVVAPPGDHEALSKAMRRLVFSADLRREMGDAAWQAGQALPSWKDQAAAFIRALEQET